MRSLTVPAKYQAVSEETMEDKIAMIITRAMINEVITEMHQAPAGKIIDPGFRDHTTCHPKIS
jgi:hypothetical protein